MNAVDLGEVLCFIMRRGDSLSTFEVTRRTAREACAFAFAVGELVSPVHTKHKLFADCGSTSFGNSM